MSSKVSKGVAKKLRKQSEKGGINNLSQLAQCEEHNIHVKAEIELDSADNIVRPISDIQEVILSIMQAMTSNDNYNNFKVLDWIFLKNKAAIQHVNVITISDIPPTEDIFKEKSDEVDNILSLNYKGGITIKLSQKDHGLPLDVFDSILNRPQVSNKNSLTSRANKWKTIKKRKHSDCNEEVKEVKEPRIEDAINDKDEKDLVFSHEHIYNELKLKYVLGIEKCKVLGFPTMETRVISDTASSSNIKAISSVNLLLDSLVDVIPSLEVSQRILHSNRSEYAGAGVNDDVDDVLPTGYVASLSSNHDRKCYSIVALDCEMCLTGSENDERSELTRVTLIDIDSNVILDEYVKPYNEVTNYLTPHSGITREILEPVQTRLEQIQVALLKYVDVDTIVVGHSLENDFQALQFIHWNNCDTSVLYHSSKGINCKPSLKSLALQYLDGKVIQNSSEGHSSVEDSQTALDLAVLKVRKGEEFGKLSVEELSATSCKLYDLISPDIRSVFIADAYTLKRHFTKSSFCHTITESEKSILPRIYSEMLSGWQFLSGRISYSTVIQSKASNESDQTVPLDKDENASLYAKNIHELFSNISKFSQENTLTIIVVQKSTEQGIKLARQRKACSNIRSSSVWSTEQEREYKACLKSIHEGRVFLSLK